MKINFDPKLRYRSRGVFEFFHFFVSIWCAFVWQKCNGLHQPECRKFSFDPRVTNNMVLRLLLIEAFKLSEYVSKLSLFLIEVICISLSSTLGKLLRSATCQKTIREKMCICRYWLISICGWPFSMHRFLFWDWNWTAPLSPPKLAVSSLSHIA